jgi:hypothetical protein
MTMLVIRFGSAMQQNNVGSLLRLAIGQDQFQLNPLAERARGALGDS